MMMTDARRMLLLAALITVDARSAAAADREKEPSPSTTWSSSTSTKQGELAEKAIEHTIVLGVGGAGEFELGEGSFHQGANVFVEYEAIDDWLELELGASLLFAEAGVEIPIDLLVKKPFQLSRRVEFMPGLGPELVSVSGTGKDGTFGGIEFALDFMFWPSGRVGLWIEPSYDIVFRDGISHGVGGTGGLIFGW
jgi:hypothetical protein